MLRRGFGATELAFTIGVLSLLAASFLPQLLKLRESTRSRSCRNNLRQIGLAMDTYHERHLSFPSGYFPSDYTINQDGIANWGYGTPSYAWSALLLGDLGYQDLYDQLGASTANLAAVVNDPVRRPLLRNQIQEYRCGSDQIGEAMDSAPIPPYQQLLDRDTGRVNGVYGGASSYVANGGYFELNHPLQLAPSSGWLKQLHMKTGPNNGVFHPASRTHRRQIVDGLSQTISVGERAWYQGSASWVGTANVRGVEVGDSGVCLARVWWRINQLPQSIISEVTGPKPVVVTRENLLLVRHPHSARNGFGSYHLGGANFLMADGSVRFIDDHIDFANTIPVAGANPLDPIPNVEKLGLFQKLGIRNDSLRSNDANAEIAQ